MKKPNYIVKAGETLRLQLKRIEGDISVVADVVCKMKKAGPNGTIPPPESPSVATLTTSIIEDGWDFILSDEETALLTPGCYVADARLNLVDDGVMITDAVVIKVDPSVS